MFYRHASVAWLGLIGAPRLVIREAAAAAGPVLPLFGLLGDVPPAQCT